MPGASRRRPSRPLCMEPPKVGVMDDARRVADALGAPSDRGADQTLSSEQCHLGVVGDRRLGPEVTAEPGWPTSSADLCQIHELDRRAERVTDGATDQAASEPVEELH